MKTYNQLKQEIQSVEEGKRGLWDNIHAKRERIKNGSGEHMRKPGSKGAPTAQAFKDANEEVMAEGKEDKIAQLKKDHATAVHWSQNERSPQKREAARRKAETIKAHLEKQYKQGVAEGAPIVVMPSPERLKKTEPTKVRYQGDIVPPTQPPSTEKRGVKGRPGQRPMPKYESVEDIFDLIEDVIEDIAKENNVDSDLIWEDLESITDEELLEVAAWQRKEGKNPDGGLNQKGVDSYRREHPGSKLQTAVTTKPSKLKPGSKAANRRKSFCARMGGMKKRLTSAETARDPDSRINKALRKWNC